MVAFSNERVSTTVPLLSKNFKFRAGQCGVALGCIGSGIRIYLVYPNFAGSGGGHLQRAGGNGHHQAVIYQYHFLVVVGRRVPTIISSIAVVFSCKRNADGLVRHRQRRRDGQGIAVVSRVP